MKKRLLSALLVLCMMLTLLPATASAAGIEALQSALDAGGTVTLGANITGNFTVKTGKSVTLNLNGKTLTNSTGDTITVEYGASLFITGKGTVDNKTHAKAAIFNNGTVVLSGGTYDRTSETGSSPDVSGGNSWYTICNHGTMTINAGVTVKNTGSFSSMIENGYYNYSSTDPRSGYVTGINSANPTLTINGGTFTGGLNSVKNDDGGILTINGGSFSNTTQAAVLNWNQATINDGTFVVTAADQNCILNGTSAAGNATTQDLGQLTITGGSFTSPEGVASVANNFENVAPSITGGTFSSDVSAFGETAGYKAVKKNSKYVVVTDTAAPVAKIDDLGFSTLVNAVAAAQSGDAIVLQDNASGAGIGTFRTATNGKGVKDFIIDFNTYTYTCTGPAVGSTGTESQAFHLEWTGNGSNNANVTLKNGTITSTANSGVKMLVQNYCNLTLDSITLDGSNLNVGGYTLSNNCGNVTIKDSTIIAPTGVVAFDACDYASYTGVTVTVEGNSNIQGPVEVVNHNGGENNAHLILKGGTFTTDKVGTNYAGGTAELLDYLADNYTLQYNDDGTYTVVTKSATAAQVVAATPTVELPELENDADNAAAGAIKTELENTAGLVTGTGLNAATGAVADSNTLTAVTIVDGDKTVLDKLNAVLDSNVDASNVTIVIQPYMDVKIVDLSTTSKTITLDITPMYKTVATTANLSANDEIVLKEEDEKAVNAVQIGTAQKLTITKSVTITIPLPTGFATGGNLYIKHAKSSSRSYYYTGTVDSNVLTFTNPHGFSKFTIASTNGAEAEINGIGYDTLTNALADAKAGDTVTVLQNDLTATMSGSTRTITLKNTTSSEITVTINGQELTIAENGAQEYTYTKPSSSSSGGGGAATYSVSTSSTTNGTISVSPKSAAKDATVTVTVKPNDGYVLDTLTVTDKDGKAIELTKKSATQYTFKMPASKVTISATFAAETVEPTSPFSDVATSAYYYDAVLWAVDNGITNGTTATTFSPNADVSRAQMVTFLWRAAGSPKATGVNPFTDVKSSDYYYDAVLWAVANGVTNGTTETTFSPAKAVSRAQAVTFQWRAAGSPAASADSFADVAADAYYADAVAWAVANEITNGMSATSFGPDVTVSRAQAVTFLYRAAN